MDVPYKPIIKSLTIKLQSKTNLKEDVCFYTTIFFELMYWGEISPNSNYYLTTFLPFTI